MIQPTRKPYPKNRKESGTRNTNRKGTHYYNSAVKRRLRELVDRLMGYAPPFSPIFTLTYGRSEFNRYQYVDVFCLYNNNLIKITKLVAKIIKTPTLKSKNKFYGFDVLALRTFKDNKNSTRNEYHTNEAKMIEQLSMIMFSRPDGYVHNNLQKIVEFTEVKIDQNPYITKKSYIVRKPT